MPPHTLRRLTASDLSSVGGCQVYSPSALRAVLGTESDSGSAKPSPHQSATPSDTPLLKRSDISTGAKGVVSRKGG